MPTLALLIWPFVATFFFFHLRPERALIVSLLIGYLFLPENFRIDLPSLPDFEKWAVITFGMLPGLLLFGRKHVPIRSTMKVEFLNRDIWFGRILLLAAVVVIFGQVFTILSNNTRLFFGPTVLPAMRPWDFVSTTWNSFLFLIPFFLGRKYLRTADNHRTLLHMLVVAGLCYSLFILVELRLSPQMNAWIYGYHQHSFAQHVRGGGYRPKVFLRHGLWVGFFLFSVVIAALALSRGSNAEAKQRYLWAALWMLVILLVSKNLGAVLITFLLIGLLFLSTNWQKRAITVIVLIFLAYPGVRQAGFVPVDRITSIAEIVSEDRAQSFQFRLDNEDLLLKRALEKPAFGWGGWSRGRVFDERGVDISVTDGTWIIVLGAAGWVGYLSFFTLLTLPLLALRRTARRKEIPIETMALALIMLGNLIYLIPNSALSPIAWLMVGALAGFVQFDSTTQASAPAANPPSPPKHKNRYTRFDTLNRGGS